MNKNWITSLVWIAILLLVLAGIVLLSLCTGSSGIPLGKLWSALFSGKAGLERSILLDIRLPRIVLGFAVGGSLGLAGVILQGLFRNPLVEPYTLGISGGAALGISFCIAFNINLALGIFFLPAFGFIGALGVILLLYFLGWKRKSLPVQNILLLGVMVTFISSSLLMLIMSLSRAENLQKIIFWMMGSLEQPRWELILFSCFISIIGLFISGFFSTSLNAMALGDEGALHLGIDTEQTRKILFVIAAVLTSVSVSVAGIIGFVGLLVPHFMRLWVGNDYRTLLFTSFLAGASFLILSDTIARTIISPLELPVGVITGLIGGVLVIYTLSTRRKAL